jgi:hypothetical protein
MRLWSSDWIIIDLDRIAAVMRREREEDDPPGDHAFCVYLAGDPTPCVLMDEEGQDLVGAWTGNTDHPLAQEPVEEES